ncbi:GyrI-like domain-containing protein [Nocardioides sp. zg-536]|uniref:GyrI-like domain-containing protein n=1 Tax=Nocardioides faecalis TaxID=2803858 RepID=A0A938YCS2_9ACTN|nr:GyrI-like domain-containing protein [Nocardioides faecalis]MBM9461631.1 GyrI-like domain-containing protein [Nocardioides faecalis]QVI57409.1 GyrI-like domain-containing protein [Nocardioides faecalis]
MKVDLKKDLDCYAARRGEPRVLDVPPLQYLMVDGHGDPNTAEEYTQALEALYPVAYALKLASKRQLDRDYVVMPLEGLWSAADPETFTSRRDKSQWDWTMMILAPDWITAEQFAAAVAEVERKRSPAALDRVRLAPLVEGRCVQVLHVGSYDDEGPTVAALHAFAAASGLRPTGRHHEIYLGDPRRTAPERLRTILRQPVAPAG